MYKRSKSTASAAYGESFRQRKRSGFWSFFHLYSSKHQITSTTKKVENFSHSSRPRNQITETSKRGGIDVIVEEEDDESPNNKAETPTNNGGSSFGRKVLRSRSVGCGSRSFSGDFFERISSGFGDCALRRTESQREPNKVTSNGGGGGQGADAMSEMVKCGGIFSGSWGWAFASPMRAKTHRGRTITESKTDKNTSPNLDSIPSLLALRS
ncbi:unnamed protein product [Arabis nemorensis]|uniref:Uncharacterized protein n=1 Tax=Arabis nemorensis TaxID=586526 RepID=A0A565B6L5_9BRAS|nr:unnamed protein product [Arabis nemorensis]